VGRRLRVLLADDEVDSRQTARFLLEQDGRFDIVGEASDGEECVRAAYDLQPDAVVVDLHMPALDGMAAIPLLRRGVPGASIVVLSVTKDAAVRREATRLGADTYVAKADIDGLPDAVVGCFGE